MMRGRSMISARQRRGFCLRLERQARGVRPPLTGDQQLRLLQLALNVKLKREGKPPDSIRLAILKRGAGMRATLPVASSAPPPHTANRPTAKAR
jgi:hypothetical protein